MCKIAALVAAASAMPAAAQEIPGGEPARQATECLAQAVYFEARGTGEKSREAVAYVIVNRAEDPDFPDTVCGVVADGCQFSYQCDGKPEVLAEPRDRVLAFETAEAVLEGAAPDPSRGALYFHQTGARPTWSKRFDRTAEIGGHVFYR